MAKKTHQGLIIIDCVGLLDPEDIDLVKPALVNALDSAGLRVVVLADFDAGHAGDYFERNRFAANEQPRIMKGPWRADVSRICSNLAGQYKLAPEHCIYFSPRYASDTTNLHAANKLGMHTLSMLGVTEDKGEIIAVPYIGKIVQKDLHLTPLPFMDAVKAIIKAWEPALPAQPLRRRHGRKAEPS
ncbi:MAG: hypothetical protein M3N08_05340 [Pseudomonadota bacterium]|nr:hypothetical protein [Pseudomonadota bacterium]